MRLGTIWTLPGMPVRERLLQTFDVGCMKVAALLPDRLAYWTVIVRGGRCIGADEAVPDVRYMDIVSRMPSGRS